MCGRAQKVPRHQRSSLYLLGHVAISCSIVFSALEKEMLKFDRRCSMSSCRHREDLDSVEQEQYIRMEMPWSAVPTAAAPPGLNFRARISRRGIRDDI